MTMQSVCIARSQRAVCSVHSLYRNAQSLHGQGMHGVTVHRATAKAAC